MLDIKNISSYLIIAAIFILQSFTGCDKEVSSSPVEPDPENNRIIVSSVPANATIFQNGRNTGRRTPDSLTYLESGTYELLLRIPHYKDTSVTISVSNDQRKNIHVDFLSNPSMYGRIIFYSIPPGANIFLNDSSLNRTTPDTLDGLLPGLYSAKFKLENYRDGEFNVLVESSVTRNVSLALVDTSIWVDYQINNSNIPSNLLTAIMGDNFNNIWMGSWDKGLIKFDGVDFVNYESTNSGIPANSIKCLNISPTGDIWIGTSEGFAIFNGSSWNVINNTNSELINNEINSIKFDNNGKAWIATNNGFVSYDGVDMELFNYSSPRFQYLWVTDLEIEQNNKVWIGSNTFGILSMENNTFTEYIDTTANYPTPKISATEIDLNNNIWFGHLQTGTRQGGISFYDGNLFNSIFPDNPAAGVQDIYVEDDRNIKWISSTEGLIEIDETNILSYYTTLNSHISNNNIKGVIKDGNGIIWIATFGGGLNKFKIDNQD